jgi:hypothetical protein
VDKIWPSPKDWRGKRRRRETEGSKKLLAGIEKGEIPNEAAAAKATLERQKLFPYQR